MSVAPTELRERLGRSPVAGAVRAQLGVATAQWLAGIGNLAFALLAVRVLAPADFADLGVFLGAYVLLHLPAAGIGAGTALAPGDLATRRRRLATTGLVIAAAIAASAPVTARAFSVPSGLVLALAAAAPGAALLGLERGRLFGIDDRRHIAASLVIEPAGRIVLGVGAAMAIGPTGAAVAVAAAGYCALAATRYPRTGAPAAVTERGTHRGDRAGTLATAATFVLFAVLQQQDLLVAKGRLGGHAAGLFAALSTAGGAVAFATATIPLAILPAAGRDRHTDRVAIALTGAVGLAAATIAAIGGRPLLDLMFGPAYEGVAPLFVPYVIAMGLLGLGRVLAARRCARGEHAAVARIVAGVVAVHLAALFAFGTTPGGIVAATTTATALGVGALGIDSSTVERTWTRMVAAIRSWARVSDLVVIGAFTVAAGVIRMISTRGLWVDEAITVSQARLPFGEMLNQLRTTDVHPPLHHTMVWLVIRIAGTGELAVRSPSIVAGALLVPAAFGLANALYGRRTALVAAAFVTVAPFAVWYSQEARMYSVFMLFATTALWAQVAAIRGDGRWAWAAYSASTAAMIWTQWFAVVPIAAQQLVFVGVFLQRRQDRTQRRRFLLVWAAALGAAILAVLPIVPIGLHQIGAYTGRHASGSAASVAAAPAQAGQAASSLAGAVSVYAVGANALWAVLGYHSDAVMTQLAALWPLLLLVGLGTLGRGRSNRTTALLTCIGLPALAFVAVGFLKRDLFELRYFAGVVPLLLVLLARGVTAVFARHRTQVLGAMGCVLLLLVGLVDQQLNGANPRKYDFQGALEQVTQQAEPGDVLLYEPDYLADVVDYYAPGLDSRSIDARSTVDPGARIWVLATTRVADDRATSARVGRALADLEQSGRTVVDEFEVPNVHVWELQP